MKFSALPFVLLLPLQWLAEPAVATAAQPTVQWSRLNAGCAVPGAVACGDRSYLFGPLPSNLAASCGTPSPQFEQVRLYPGEPAGLSGGNYPCSDESCLSAIPDNEPWIALIDWNNEHGLTVAETLSRVAKGMPVQLFELDAEASREVLGDAVGDAHVLMQLCAIAEHSKTTPPTVVNLSFGRWNQPLPQANPGPSLEGEIRQLIHELAKKTHFVAAAGNDGLMLFPAVIPEVLSVGALDLAAFRRGVVAPSRISPQETDAFFPANGILLEQGNVAWPLPPGTSYASALASGWLATLNSESRELVFEAVGELLAPQRTEAGNYELFLGSQKLAGSVNTVASRLLDIAAVPAADAWSKLKLPAGPRRLEWIIGEIDGIPERTWTEVRGRANSPAPDSYPCVPCADAPDPWGGGGGLLINSLLLDFGSTERFGPGIALNALYLQSGERILRFASSEDESFLHEVATGELKQLEVENLPSQVHDHELLLVWVLTESSTKLSFMRKTPITRVIWPEQ